MKSNTRVNVTIRENTSVGFTIIELVVVIVIIGILAALGVVLYSTIRADTRDSARESSTLVIAEALEKYYLEHGEYPSCDALTAEPATIVAATLPGISPSVFKAPNAASGTENSIVCSEPEVGADAYVYNIDDSLLGWTLVYTDETDTSTVEIKSRQVIASSSESGEPAVTCASLDIGDSGPGEGIIFYKDTVSNTCYESAPSEWYASYEPRAEWGCFYGNEFPDRISGASGTAIGTGKQNTADMLAANCTTPHGSGHLVAAVIATNYNGGGLSDWYLPSKDELAQLRIQRNVVGGFVANEYWSSSEYKSSDHMAWMRNFQTGGTGSKSKYSQLYIRPTRSFSD